MRGVLQSFIANTDLSLLFGRRSVLAIDVRPKSIRILELRNRTNPFKRHLPRFSIVHAIEREIPEGPSLSESERLPLIQAMLRDARITTRLVALPLSGATARSRLASVPRDVESIDQWIDEQYRSLFEFGPNREEVTIGYEVISEDEDRVQIEIICARTREVNALEESFSRNGFEVVWISNPVRALKCALDVVSPQSGEAGNFKLGLLDQGLLATDTYHHGILTAHDEVDYRGLDELPKLLGVDRRRDSYTPAEGEVRILLASRDRLEDVPDLEGIEFIRVLGVSPEYAHLVGLGVGSFYRELAGASVESLVSVERSEGRVAKALFERMMLTFGLTLVFLLGAMALARTLLDDRRAQSDEAIRRSGASVQGLQRMEAEVNELRQRLEEGSGRGPMASLLLYELSGIIPDSVYLSSLTLDRSALEGRRLSLYGYAERPTQVAMMLSSLEASERFKSVKLLRSASASTPTQILMPASLRRAPCMVFEVEIPETGIK
jgi:Tfp pilus assembly protein PilN